MNIKSKIDFDSNRSNRLRCELIKQTIEFAVPNGSDETTDNCDKHLKMLSNALQCFRMHIHQWNDDYSGTGVRYFNGNRRPKIVSI